jgi:hypothetical protein
VDIGIHTRGPIARGIPASRLALIEIRALAQSLLDVPRMDLLFSILDNLVCLAVAVELVAAALLVRRLLH